MMMKMIIDCISDLHGHYPELKGGDILIIAGDLTARDMVHEYEYCKKWMLSSDYEHIVVINGNHDMLAMEFPGIMEETRKGNNSKYHYLCDSGCEIKGAKFWGSPWTKSFPEINPLCKAFTLDTDEELADKWALIPDDTDILV